MRWVTCLLAISAANVHALNDLYWDTNGTAEGTGAITGTWGTSNFWSTDPAGLANTFQITTDSTNDLHFSAIENSSTGTITVSGTQYANGLYFDKGAPTLSGGTIVLSDGGVINSSVTPALPRLSSALYTTGTVTVSGYRVWMDNPSFNGGGTLDVNTSNALLFENGGALNGLAVVNVLSGGLDIRQSEGGYNYAAGTTTNFLSNTSLTINLSQSVNWLGDVTIASTRTASFSSVTLGSVLTVSGNVSGDGALNTSGAGIIHLTGANTYAGSTTINTTTLRISGGSALPDSTIVSMSGGTANTLEVQTSETIGGLNSGTAANSVVSIATGQTLTLTTGTQTFNGTFSGVGRLAIAGAVQTLSTAVTLAEASISRGSLTLTAASTITNGLTMTGGGFAGGTTRGSSLTLTPDITVAAGARATLGTLASGGSAGTATISFGGLFTINSGGHLMLNTPGSNSAYGTANGALVFGPGAIAGTKLQLNGVSFTLAGLGTNAGSPGVPAVENGSNTAATLTVALPAAGASVYAGTLRNGGTGALALTVNGGAGSALTLAGANTHTGNTSITGGSLILAHSRALQNSTVTTGGTGIVFDASVASHSFIFGGLTGSADLVLEDNGGNAVTLTVANTATQTYTGILSGTGGLTKAGTGIYSLSTAHTYSGNTTVNGGELHTYFLASGSPTDNIINPSSTLVLGGGIYVERQYTSGPNKQTFNGLVIRAGSSAVNQIRVGGGAMLLTLGALTREAGGTVAFSANGGGMASGIDATGTNTASGIIGGYATYLTTNGGATLTNATDWATYSGGKIVALGSGSYTNTAATTASTNLNLTTSVALNANVTVGSIRFNDAFSTPTLTLNGTHTVGSGGILVTPTVAGNATLITGGSITSGNGQDLIIIQNNTNAAGALTVDATISGAVGLTKSGGGQLILAGTNTYTGPTYLNGGVTSISSNANLGAVSTGAAVHLNGGTLAATNTLALDDAGSSARGVVLGNNGGTLDVAAGQTLTVSGTLSGAGTLNKSGTGALLITGNTSTHTGATTVSAGTLQVGVAGSGQTGPGDLFLNGANAALAGTGTVQGTTTVTTGTIRPGDAAGASIGTLTTGSLIFTPAASTTVAELQITGSAGAGTLANDRIIINGALTLNGSSNIVVTGTGYTPTLGDSFVLLDWSGVLDTGITSVFNTGSNFRTGANVGNEGNLDLPDLSSFNLGWEVINFSGNGSLTIVVVPEVGRGFLLLGGLLALGLRRRRRTP